jgi:hypothetical protein
MESKKKPLVFTFVNDIAILNILKKIEKNLGLHYFTFYPDFNSLFSFMEVETPDLIILELLKTEDSTNYLVEFRSEDSPFKNIPIIFIMDPELLWERGKAFSTGNFDYMVKPANIHEVISKINLFLRLNLDNSEKKYKNLEILNEKIELKTSKFFHIINLSNQLNAERDLEKIFHIVVSRITKIMGAERSSLFILNQATGELWSKAAEGLGDIIVLPKGKGIAGKVAISSKPVIIPDTSKNEDFDPSWDKKTGFTTKNMVCFPIKNRNGVLKGVLQIINLDINSFIATDMALAGACASLIGVAIENIESIVALQNLLMHK